MLAPTPAAKGTFSGQAVPARSKLTLYGAQVILSRQGSQGARFPFLARVGPTLAGLAPAISSLIVPVSGAFLRKSSSEFTY